MQVEGVLAELLHGVACVSAGLPGADRLAIGPPLVAAPAREATG